MNAAMRMRSIRLMEKMEKASANGNTRIEKADETMKYKNENNEVLFEIKMKRS